MRFDFERFIEEIPFDLHDITGDILRKTLGDLLVADKKKFDKQVGGLFRKITAEFGVLNGKYLARWGTENFKADDAELRLGMFPVVLKSLVEYMPIAELENLFECLIGVESEDFMVLTEKSFAVGVDYMNKYNSQADR